MSKWSPGRSDLLVIGSIIPRPVNTIHKLTLGHWGQRFFKSPKENHNKCTIFALRYFLSCVIFYNQLNVNMMHLFPLKTFVSEKLLINDWSILKFCIFLN